MQMLIAIQNSNAPAPSTNPFQSSPPISHRDPSASKVIITITDHIATAFPNESVVSRLDADNVFFCTRKGSTSQNPQSVTVTANAPAQTNACHPSKLIAPLRN